MTRLLSKGLGRLVTDPVSSLSAILTATCNRSVTYLTSILGVIWGTDGMRAQTENNRQRDRNARYRTTPGRWPSPPISARPCGPTASGDSRIGSQLQSTEPDATNTTPRNRSTSSDRPKRLADYRDTHDDATTNRAFQHQTSAHLRWRSTGGPVEAGGEGVGSWPAGETSWGFDEATQTDERRQKCPNRTS